MSAAVKTHVARRPLLAGLGALVVAVVAAAAIEAPRFLGPHYAPSPFDDLLAQLPDRAGASRLGAAFAAGVKTFDADKTAVILRQRLAGRSLAAAMDFDLAHGRMVEVRGWVLPETLVFLCALAAKAG